MENTVTAMEHMTDDELRTLARRAPEPELSEVRILRGRVLIETVPPANLYGGIIHIPDVAQKSNAAQGVVRAVGSGVTDVAIGDEVFFEPVAMSELTSLKRPNGQRVCVIPEENILAVVELERCAKCGAPNPETCDPYCGVPAR